MISKITFRADEVIVVRDQEAVGCGSDVGPKPHYESALARLLQKFFQ
jgi:hypothetical protein